MNVSGDDSMYMVPSERKGGGEVGFKYVKPSHDNLRNTSCHRNFEYRIHDINDLVVICEVRLTFFSYRRKSKTRISRIFLKYHSNVTDYH